MVRSFPQERPIWSLTFSPDGRYILSGAVSGEPIILWDVTTGRKVRSFGSGAWSVAFSPDGHYALSGGRNSVTLWDVLTGRQVWSFSGHTDAVLSVVFSPDGLYAISGSRDKSLRLLDTTTGREIRSFFGHTNWVHSVAFSPDGHYILSGSYDKTMKLWDAYTGKEVRTLSRRVHGTVWSADFSPDGRYIVSSSSDKTLKLWDLATGQKIRSFFGHTEEVFKVVFDPKGRYVASVSGDGVRLWDPNAGKEVRFFPGHTSLALAFSPDGKYISYASATNIELWNIYTGQKVVSLHGHSDAIHSVAFSPDGRYVVSGSVDKTMRLWDASTGHEMRAFHGHNSSVNSVAFSPDGRYALSGSSDRVLKLWDISTGREIRAFRGHESEVWSVTFSPDGRYALSGSMDNTSRLWDINTGREVRTFTGHKSWVTSVTFSPDGRYVLSGSHDGTSRIWAMDTGEMLLTMVDIGETDYIATAPDGYYIASRDALKWVSFEAGNRVFPFEQFDLRLNRPDIILERLGTGAPKIIAAYRYLYQKRLRKMGFTEDMLSADYHAPEVAILAKDIPLSTASRSLTFRIRGTDSKYLLDRINVHINDVPIYGVDGIPLRAEGKKSVEKDIQITLANGDNKVQVLVLNAKGVESLKETFSIVYNGPSEKPDVYVLAIGVSKYQDVLYNLQYAAKDAVDLAFLYQNGFDGAGEYGKVNILTITDEEATRENIVRAKAFLQRSKVDDLVILFVAGHGLTDENLDYYYATHDIDFSAPQARGLPFEELDNLLSGIPALQKLFLMDTCFSGEIDKTEMEIVVADAGIGQGIDGQVRARAFIDKRGFRARQRVNDEALKIQEDVFADLRRGTGAVIITSSSGDEYSFESSKWRNGVFTYCLLRGMKERAADSNSDKKISVNELQDYVIHQVQALTNGGQNPTVRRENLENDFVVW